MNGWPDRGAGDSDTHVRALSLVLFPLVLASLLVGCRNPSAPRAAVPPGVSQALAEFRGAYPLEATPNGTVRSFDVVAAPTTAALYDGHQLRVWAYNGTVPGPTLRIRLGETLRVNFTNRLPQETTIHWHGVRLPNAMDGVPNATQPPVKPGETFVYEFTPKDAGTFWFHPHVRSSEQVERGLYGVLIVEDAEPLPYSRDVMWVLDDWLLDGERQIDGRFNTRSDLAHDGRWGNVFTVNARTDTTLTVRPGERIRLRMLNAANGRVFEPDFSALGPSLIAMDGMTARKPVPLDGQELAPGNRMDLDLVIPADAAGKSFQIVDRFSARRATPLATIVVAGEPVKTPGFASQANAHVPVWSQALQAPLHHDYRLNARAGGPFGIEWTIDGVAFAGHDSTNPHAHHAEVALRAGDFYRLRFTNESARLHPIHLHGMFFRLISRNGVFVDEPFFRDTVLIRGRETVDIALVPTDVGLWMLHCHILEHAEAGMMTMIRVREGGGASAHAHH